MQDYDSGLECDAEQAAEIKQEDPPPAPAKKVLSDAQKASLARAREEARASKLAKTQAKADAQREFQAFREKHAKPASPVKQKEEEDEEMSDSSAHTNHPL